MLLLLWHDVRILILNNESFMVTININSLDLINVKTHLKQPHLKILFHFL